MHQHKAKTERTVGWTHCVASGHCSGKSHGGVTFVATCSCGAVRKVESNGGATKSSGWISQDDASCSQCGASPGESCLTADGNPTAVHSEYRSVP